MAKSATAQKPRAPQGAKRVAQAFLNELGTIAEDKQADVGKAAQAMIRDALIARREKAKSAKAKSRASTTALESGRGARGGRKARTASARKTTRQRRGGSSQSESGEEQNGH